MSAKTTDETERLRLLGAEVQNARGDAETRAAEARAALDALRTSLLTLATELAKDRRGRGTNTYNTGYSDGHHDARVEVGHRLTAILAQAEATS